MEEALGFGTKIKGVTVAWRQSKSSIDPRREDRMYEYRFRVFLFCLNEILIESQEWNVSDV